MIRSSSRLRSGLLFMSFVTCPFSQPLAAPAPAHELPRAVTKRLNAWQRPAPATFTARYTLTRRTSMLWDPLVVHGDLSFAPGRLELRDDEPTGATTVLHGERAAISLNDPTLPPGPAVQPSPALVWLQDRLFALLAGHSRDDLLKDTRASIPRGGGQQLDLAPLRTHPAQAVIDHLRVRLDPDTGEVLELELLLVDGDRVLLTLERARPAPPA